MKKRIALFIIVLAFALFTGCTNKVENVEVTTEETSDVSKEPVELTILAAASLTEVTEKLAKQYKTIAPNVYLTFSYGASGTLQTQIEEGVPADLFLSAASKQMDALEKEGLLLSGTRKDLLQNELVLIVPKDSSLGITGFEDLAKDSVKMVALGEPKGVPAGQYAEEVFTSMGILAQVKEKANYGSDVKQVLTWVETKEAECGLVYTTDAISNDNVTIVCEAPKDSHGDIVYPAAVIKNSTAPDETKAFLYFLSSEEAKKIFEEFGFVVN